MKKVMIVDDEILVRVGIKSILNWEENGYCVVCDAVNGLDALEKMEQYHPDLVLTDLMMDKMDGFELISQCKTQYPETKFIVLSSYNDFDNVRKAMKLGAADYIFKLTAKPEDMLSVLDEVSKSLKAAPAEKDADVILLKNISAIKNRLIKTAIQQSYLKESELLEEFVFLKLKTNFNQQYVSLYISIDNFYARQRNGEIQEIQLLKFSLENIVHEVISKNRQAETYNYDRGDLIALINLGAEESYDQLCAELRDDVGTIIEYVKRYLGIEVSASLSEAFTGVNQIKCAVNQNLQALTARFLSGGGELYIYRNTEVGSVEFILPDYLKPSQLEELLWNGNFEQIEEYLKKFWSFCRTERAQNAEKIRIELLELYHRFRKHALKDQIDFDNLLDGNSLTLYEAITRYDTISCMEESFSSMISQYRGLLENCDQGKCHREITEVKQYVRQNLRGNLSVQAAAKLANMSESYFAHLFKSEMGMSFVSYVNKMRVEHAETLLRETDEKIGTIALDVGVDNPNYFSILFKKITGKSPNEYRS